MKYLTYTLSAFFLSATTYAVEIPNQFEDGQVTSASQMNENFQALKVEIEALKTQLEQSQTTPKVEFKGYSAPISGTSGIAEFTAACEVVSLGSRMCVGDELVNLVFAYPESYAWIARNRTNAGITTGGGGTYIEVWYGKTSSCATDDASHFITSDGKLVRYTTTGDGCHSTNIHPVACCK